VLGRSLAIAVAALLLAPSIAGAAAKAIWGPILLPNGRSAFPVYRDLGVDVFQLQLSWAAVAGSRPARPSDPADPAYRWPARVALALREAKAHGVKVALLVEDTPAWANGGRPPNWAPDNPDDYGAFMAAAARRYRAVRRWMVWGEPNRAAQFAPMPPNSPVGPRRYAVLLDRAYAALKHVRRSNKVIGGMTFTSGEVSAERFLHWMLLPAGRPPRLDYYGHDPYGARFPRLSLRPDPAAPGARDFADLDTLSRQVRRTYRRRHRNPKLWVAEYGVGTAERPGGFPFFVSEAEQRRRVTAAYRAAHRSRRIAGLGWFTLMDRTGPTGHYFGLLRPDGSRKPAYAAYRRAR